MIVLYKVFTHVLLIYLNMFCWIHKKVQIPSRYLPLLLYYNGLIDDPKSFQKYLIRLVKWTHNLILGFFSIVFIQCTYNFH